MKLRNVFLFIVGFSVFSCASKQEIIEVTPTPPVIEDRHLCMDACTNLRSLGCVEGDYIDTQKKCADSLQCAFGQDCLLGTCQASCETFCFETESNGVWLDPGCVSQITSCDMIESCPALIPKQ